MFAPDPERLAVLAPCIAHHGVGDDTAEWPNNLISRRTLVFGSGRIGRALEEGRHTVAAAELAACRRLAHEAAALMAGVEVGMGSEGGDGFAAFFCAGIEGEPVPKVLDAALIRARFNGTLFPPVSISVEPLAEKGGWWREVCDDGGDLAPWRTMVAWFRNEAAFTATAFVRIGDWKHLHSLPERDWPPGTALTGCCMPRLALGLTAGGSLAGLFGHSVQS